MKEVKALSANEILQGIFIYLTEISALKEHDDIIRVLASMGRTLTSADRCTVWIVSDDKKTIWTKIAEGMEPIEIPITSGIVGASITNEKKIIVDDAYADERFNPRIDEGTGYRTKSIMVMPMFNHDDEVIGAFQVINHQGRKDIFTDSDMQRLMLASTYAAETIVTSQLIEEIEETQKEVVFTMGAIGESRSQETGNHVRRVAEYSKILALAYGLPSKEAELLKQASPMHDIGKVAIPDSILNKPGRFNKSERAIMDTHAELGYQMTNKSKRPILKAASIVAYEHHEKWDGTGYPNKKSGEDIHIYGRITAIADVFDALGSDRVYKKAWKSEKILNYFKEERGKHFDPTLIDMFFDNLDKIHAVQEEFKDEYVTAEKVDEDEFDSIRALGAFGTKLKGHGTTSFCLNGKNVIDAGNLLNALEEKSAYLDNIWVSHSHLDHICDIAYIVDNYFDLIKKTINIRALPETIDSIKKHFLNDLVWPDFSKIKLVNGSGMCIKYIEVNIDEEYALSSTETIKAFETDHTVASCGYIYKKDEKSILIATDTYEIDNILEIVNNDNSIKSMILECSFPSHMDKLALESKHLTAKLLSEKLVNLKRDDVALYINHIKPLYLEEITKEIDKYLSRWKPKIVKDGEIIKF